jgi:hypothetical protein
MQRKQESAVKEGKRREAGKARAVKAGRASAKKKACIVKARKRREAGKAWQGRAVPPALSGRYLTVRPGTSLVDEPHVLYPDSTFYGQNRRQKKDQRRESGTSEKKVCCKKTERVDN